MRLEGAEGMLAGRVVAERAAGTVEVVLAEAARAVEVKVVVERAAVMMVAVAMGRVESAGWKVSLVVNTAMAGEVVAVTARAAEAMEVVAVMAVAALVAAVTVQEAAATGGGGCKGG